MSNHRRSLLPVIFLCSGLVIALSILVWFVDHRREGSAIATAGRPRRFNFDNRLTLWWDEVPTKIRQTSSSTQTHSNIHPSDYVGPESCAKCHKKNYDSWSAHPHRWMNALATKTTVKGDFDNASIKYLGGRADFFQTDNGEYRMRLKRDGRTLVYSIRQTIGSRFFQYYVGVMIEASLNYSSRYFEEDHVLPFGYWLDRHEWVPVVHVHDVDIHDELPDGRRPDPFDPDLNADRAQDKTYFAYSASCNYCHTTFPLGDMLIRNPRVLGRHAPTNLHWSMADYLRGSHRSLVGELQNPRDVQQDQLLDLMADFAFFEAPDHAVTLGVSCEACHLGGREHAEQKAKRPAFTPNSPHLYISNRGADHSRSEKRRAYINWACGRCHAGPRPTFANGISTWNSTEYSDAMRGSCYSELTCVDCHNPHERIGVTWTRTAVQDDASCLKCHQELENAEQRFAHTHHPTGSTGDRCMNCHMPRINEGLQDVVRTHTIFSPTDREMIESNHPNACNLCHLDQPIDWTVEHLQKWYGVSYSEAKLADSYPRREGPVGTGWLQGDFESVRLVAAAALTRNDCRWAIKALIEALDDPYLLNRQFAMKGIEAMLSIHCEDFGYRFYMTPEERQDPIRRMRSKLVSKPPAE